WQEGECGGAVVAAGAAYSGRRSEARGRTPLPETLCADLTVLLGGKKMAAGARVVADSAEGLQEPLGMLRRLGPLQRPFSLPHGPVGVLRAVSQALVPPVLGIRQDALERGRVARELIGDHHPRCPVLDRKHTA